MRQAIVAINQNGFVAKMNAAAVRGFDNAINVKGGRLFLRDPEPTARLEAAIDRLKDAPATPLFAEQVIIRRRDNSSVIVSLCRCADASRQWPQGWFALLILNDLRMKGTYLPGERPDSTTAFLFNAAARIVRHPALSALLSNAGQRYSCLLSEVIEELLQGAP